MKILQIDKYFYKKGGAETVFFNTIQLLEKHGHTVIPFALKSEKNLHSPFSEYFVGFPELSESGLGMKCKKIFSFIYNKEAARQLDRLLSVEKPDIAHIHLFMNGLSVSILPVLRRHKVPVVMSLHDYRLICPTYLFLDRKGNICERCMSGHFHHCALRRCYRGNFSNSFMLAAEAYFRKYFIRPAEYIDHAIPVSHFAKRKLVDFLPELSDRCSVLHNFTLIQEKPVAEKGNYILYLGRISAEKGIPVLLEAMKGLPEINLKVVGTGPLLAGLQKDTLPNVEYLGFKAGDELEDLVRRARFIIVPSICYENNPMVILESFVLGTPVIASCIGGIPELVKDGQNGYLFEPKSAAQLGDCILQACQLPEEDYLRMCGNAQAFARGPFTEEAYYPKLMDIYNLTLNQYK
ncbi:glycosyl transferase [Bacteroidia bacterium]|nr:glycosyl transferase [Bacteroidia bacterium]